MTQHLVKCGSCGASNRISAEKEGVPGQCGNCRAKLPALYLHPQPLNDGNFEAFISEYGGAVLAEFWAPW